MKRNCPSKAAWEENLWEEVIIKVEIWEAIIQERGPDLLGSLIEPILRK
jgi:hypothetical protein